MTPISNKAELARARRILRRLEEDAPNVVLRLADQTPEAREMGLHLFQEELERQREYVRELENSC